MSSQLERGAEITRLARLLGVPPKELGYLDRIPAGALREFREQATDRLFAGDAARLNRVAAASKLLPVPLAVKIAQLAFGPLLCSATAGLLDPRHAVRIAAKCPVGFLADITITLDPRRAADVIAAVPTRLVVDVAKELVARDEHVTMGRFVSYLSHETLRAAVAEIPDDADLLKIAFVMEGKERLDALLDVARPRFGGLVRTAYEQQLWAEALDLIGNVSVANLAELADIAAAQDDNLLDALVHAAQDLHAWDALLPITAGMSPDSLRRFAEVPALQEPQVLRTVVETALAGPQWLDLLPLSRYLPDAAREQLAALLAAENDATLERLANQADEAQLWDDLISLARSLTPEARGRLADRARALGRTDLVDALDTA